MPNQKTTALPENTSPNDNDKIYIVSAAGFSKYIRSSTLRAFFLQGVSTDGSKFRGYKTNSASILALEDPQDGEGAIDRSTNNLWVYVENDSDGNPVNAWINTGEYGPVFELDAFPTLGNTDHVPSSDGVAQEIAGRAPSIHDHSISETWLISALSNYILSTNFNNLFWNQLKNSVTNGAGATFNFNEGTKVLTISVIGADGEPITISSIVAVGSGDAINSIAAIKYAARKTKYVDIAYASNIEIDCGDESPVKIRITDVTGDFEIDDILSNLNDPNEVAVELQCVAELSGIASAVITVPSYVTEGGFPLPGNQFTIGSTIVGEHVSFAFEKREGEWELFLAEDPTEIDGSPDLSLPIDISDVTGLQGELDDLQSQIDSFDPGSGATNLGASLSAANVIITSDTGSDVTIPPVDATNAGVVTPTQKGTWDGKQDSLGFTPVPNTRTVNGHALSADVTVTKSDVGLGSVDNTADSAKPVSTAQQTALDGKVDLSDFSPLTDATPVVVNCNSKQEPKFYYECPASRTLDVTNLRGNNDLNKYSVVTFIVKKITGSDVVLTLDTDYTNKDIFTDADVLSHTLTGALNSYFKITALVLGQASGAIIWWNKVSINGGATSLSSGKMWVGVSNLPTEKTIGSEFDFSGSSIILAALGITSSKIAAGAVTFSKMLGSVGIGERILAHDNSGTVSGNYAVETGTITNSTVITALTTESGWSNDTKSVASTFEGQFYHGTGSTGIQYNYRIKADGTAIRMVAGEGTVITDIQLPPCTEVTGTTQAAAINNSYVANNASQVVVTLPSTASIGDVVEITGKGAGGWRLAQNSGQQIHGDTSSTSGTGGYVQSNSSQYAAIRVKCITANTTWVIQHTRGAITIA